MQKLNFQSHLESSRIYIKKHEEALAAQMFAHVDRDRMRLGQFLPWVPYVQKIEDELNYIQHSHKCWDEAVMFDYGIFKKGDDTYIGNIGVHTINWSFCCCEIGYWILGDYEGQGYVREAVQLIEKYLFELGFHRIEIRCASANRRSARIPASCGYVFDGALRERQLRNAIYYTDLVFSKLSHDYKKPAIHPMTDQDFDEVLEIVHQVKELSDLAVQAKIRADFFAQKGFVYRMDDRVVGFVTYFSDQGVGSIRWLGVLPQYRTQDIEEALVLIAEKRMKDFKIDKIVHRPLV